MYLSSQVKEKEAGTQMVFWSSFQNNGHW
jgi:hypothetical protein